LYTTLVYPVPVKGAYFLGVHSTLTIDGYVKIGPTASPAFSLENYKGFENVNFKDLSTILTNYVRLLFSS
jgi:L-2-hydroxyglutarate oxidase